MKRLLAVLFGTIFGFCVSALLLCTFFVFGLIVGGAVGWLTDSIWLGRLWMVTGFLWAHTVTADALGLLDEPE